jgi:tetratricopeptide (TPR) repeat protein
MKLKFHLLVSIGLALVSSSLVLNLRTTFAQDKPPSSTVMAYLKEGSAFYLKNDFKSAIGPYSKALELEKKQSSLDKALWHVLVDNLGMSYGITGDLKKAKETFEYGLSKDDKYPMFYYNLACTYAEMNDLENTITQLKRAFEYRENMLVGESMPDPAKDDSFQRFMRTERFLAVLDELKKRK